MAHNISTFLQKVKFCDISNILYKFGRVQKCARVSARECVCNKESRR